MLGNGFQYFLTCLELSKFRLSLNFASLIYCENTPSNARQSKIILQHIIFPNLMITNLEHVETCVYHFGFCGFPTCVFWNVETLKFGNFRIVIFEMLTLWILENTISKFEILKCRNFENLRFWNFEILNFEFLKLWIFETLKLITNPRKQYKSLEILYLVELDGTTYYLLPTTC